MRTAVIYTKLNKKTDNELLIEYVEALMGSLKNKGQVIDYIINYDLGFRDKLYPLVFCQIPLLNSIESDNELKTYWIERIEEELGLKIHLFFFNQYNNKKELFISDMGVVDEMFIEYDGLSPLLCNDRTRLVPLHLVDWKGKSKVLEELLSWSKDYQAVYGLWYRGAMRSEQYFASQMFDVSSTLNRQGLRLRDLLSEITSIDCYYRIGYAEEIPEICPVCKSDLVTRGEIRLCKTHKVYFEI